MYKILGANYYIEPNGGYKIKHQKFVVQQFDIHCKYMNIYTLYILTLVTE